MTEVTNTKANTDDDFTLVSNTDIASSNSFSVVTKSIQPAISLCYYLPPPLSAGANNGIDWDSAPIGYIYGTPAIHGLEPSQLEAIFPEITALISASGKSAVKFGGAWIGSLEEIDIYTNNDNSGVLYPPVVGYELFSIKVSGDVTTNLFSHTSPLGAFIDGNNTKVQSSDSFTPITNSKASTTDNFTIITNTK